MDHIMADQDRTDMQEAAGKTAAAAGYEGEPSLSQQQQFAAPQADTGPVDQQQQQQQGDTAQPLTETIAVGLQSIAHRRLQIHAMIDELAQVGLHFLEQQRQQFLRTLESFKEDVDGVCADEMAKGQQLSFDTINAHERLNRAQALVQSLGGAVCQPGAGLLG